MRLVGKVGRDFVQGQEFCLRGGQGVLSLYKPKNWGIGAGQRRRGAMLSIQSGNQLKTRV